MIFASVIFSLAIFWPSLVAPPCFRRLTDRAYSLQAYRLAGPISSKDFSNHFSKMIVSFRFDWREDYLDCQCFFRFSFFKTELCSNLHFEGKPTYYQRFLFGRLRRANSISRQIPIQDLLWSLATIVYSVDLAYLATASACWAFSFGTLGPIPESPSTAWTGTSSAPTELTPYSLRTCSFD